MFQWLSNWVTRSMERAVDDSPFIPKPYIPNDDLLHDFDRQVISMMHLTPDAFGLRPGIMAHQRLGVFRADVSTGRMQTEYRKDNSALNDSTVDTNYRELSDEGQRRVFVEWRGLMSRAIPDADKAEPMPELAKPGRAASPSLARQIAELQKSLHVPRDMARDMIDSGHMADALKYGLMQAQPAPFVFGQQGGNVPSSPER